MSDKREVKVTVEDGKVTFYMSDFWHIFSDEQKRELIKHLVFEKEVFDDFVDAIINDTIVTENFSYSVYDVRKRLLDSLGELAKNHFRSLLHELEGAKLEKDRWKKLYWQLYRAIPTEFILSLKSSAIEPYVHAEWLSDDEVESEMKARQ